ncbi:MAG TPA: aromatic acid exporter family protein [Solirubrobacteraceae bacterium]|nr:aromatic acid exporter family protein [Solirubrobacteraceae bacterium]
MPERLRDPVLWSDASQLVKTAAAAVIAWVIASDVLGIAQPFLAPWAALLTVHATVYRTLARGLQQVGATVLGVVLAFLAGATLGANAVSLGLVLLAGMVAGTTRRLRAESTTAAATALVVLLTGYAGDASMLGSRLLDTLIGIAVGLTVNLLVWPPLHDRAAARRVDRIDDRMGALLCAIAERLREGGEEDDAEEWIQRTRDIDHELDATWASVRRARESGRLNPRRHAADRAHASDDLASILSRLEQATAETRSMAHTMGGSTGSVPQWEPSFREAFIDLLARTGRAIEDADVEAVEQVREDVEATARTLSSGDDHLVRPEHGALLVNLRNIADAMGRVASAQPVRSRAPDPRALPRRHHLSAS